MRPTKEVIVEMSKEKKGSFVKVTLETKTKNGEWGDPTVFYFTTKEVSAFMHWAPKNLFPLLAGSLAMRMMNNLFKGMGFGF